MASTPLSTGEMKPDFKLPMPPPLLHTRSGNEYDRPSTPTSNGFTSPYATPQGSPSKNKLPPGAKELPNIFENAMVLEPTSPLKIGRSQPVPGSPNKSKNSWLPGDEHNTTLQADTAYTPGSPLRNSNQENNPPSSRLGKDSFQTPAQTHAAQSRQEQYQSRETSDTSSRSRFGVTRGLSTEDLEKLNLPKVKRLANVTQICECNEAARVKEN